MAKLSCNVHSCIYNFGTTCSKSKIKIADLDTSCLSYHKTKKDVFEKQKYDSEFASMEGNANQYVSIECDEMRCKYNKNKLYDLEREIDDLEISDCKVKRLLLLDV